MIDGHQEVAVGLLDFRIQAASSSQGLDLNDKIKEYLREDETSFKKLWTNKRWKDSKLGGVAQAVFTIPATSAASERVFSKAGLITVPIRSKTSEKTVELLCFLRCNILEKPVMK